MHYRNKIDGVINYFPLKIGMELQWIIKHIFYSAAPFMMEIDGRLA
jgi:hypothetical protein